MIKNIAVARETVSIIKKGRYEAGGREVAFNPAEHTQVKVYTPQMGEELLNKDFASLKRRTPCAAEVVNADSFEAAEDMDRSLVMSFANAFKAGGGFALGAAAQEEALCRCSTLYASISSERAAEMYRYNILHLSRTASDYMLLSENVLVFRDAGLKLLPEPFTAGVITVPAPNRRGMAFLASAKLIEETMLRRIRILLAIAAENSYRNLVLGAWGCGAFGNDPFDVAGYFRRALFDEGRAYLFDRVKFAVHGPKDGKNFRAFKDVFEGAPAAEA